LNSNAYVQRIFQDYYSNKFELKDFSSIEKREFGFSFFDEKFVRHKAFTSITELKDFLVRSSPLDVYYSSAFYGYPTFNMHQKEWKGADLIFDIDADHILHSCDKSHDSWVCETCLNSAKKEMIKLLAILENDFGFSKKESRLFFSGNRGYHIHIESKTIRRLDSSARKELVDYITGTGIIPSYHGIDVNEKKLLTLPNQFLYATDSGWSQRLHSGLENFIKTFEENDLKALGISKQTRDSIIRKKDLIIQSSLGNAYFSFIKGQRSKTRIKLIQNVIKTQAPQIDTVVTIDIHRLIRLPNTLHSKTGMKKTEFSFSSIDKFDPLSSAIAFKGHSVNVMVKDSPVFRLGEERFGPYKNEKVSLPVAAGILLICKERAELLDE
jgi:DNA primase small subunit